MPSYENAENTRTTETEEQSGRMHEIGIEAFEQVVKEADAINWLEVPLNGSLANLGGRIDAQYARIYEGIENPDDAALFAKKWLWIAARESQLTWHGWIAESLCADNEHTQSYAATFEAGFSDLADAFSNHLAEIKYSDAIKLQRPNWQWYQPLKAIALVWFCEADALMESGNVAGALERMADAFSAIEFERGYAMWDEGQRCSAEEKSLASRNAALKFHAATTHVKRDAVIAYWRDNISADKSNEFAAELLR